ncbi:MAG TPA: FHA domain-containing protein [Mycobacteriales bacterium]|nr:FHA domain-containing protein [Mycobacteriales bacterium]
MPVAVVFLLRAVVLILLWGFVIATVVAVRSDVAERRPRLVPARPPTRKPKPSTGKAVSAPPAAKAARRTKKARKRQQPPATRVTVVEGPNAGATVRLSSLPVTIGRADDATIVLTDDYASQHHARLIPRGEEWLIEDTGSTNGTFIGDAKLTAPVVIPTGGRFRVGRNVLELQA